MVPAAWQLVATSLQLLHDNLKRTWGGCDGRNELEAWVCCDALCPLGQVQLAALQEADQAGQHVWRRQVDVLNQKPPALAYRLRLQLKMFKGAEARVFTSEISRGDSVLL